MTRAVIDTNVVVSALLSPLGNEALVLEAVRRNLCVPCFSREILKEYREVLVRPKFGFHTRQVDGLLALLREQGRMFSPKPVAVSLPDPDDAIFIACARAASAEFLVTGNKRHFPQAACGATKVVSAREFLTAL
ncbi:MAG TPA: putative toxin-antitoxin system toxin component, PIN family [Terracidiphilus sp.]